MYALRQSWSEGRGKFINTVDSFRIKPLIAEGEVDNRLMSFVKCLLFNFMLILFTWTFVFIVDYPKFFPRMPNLDTHDGFTCLCVFCTVSEAWPIERITHHY